MFVNYYVAAIGPVFVELKRFRLIRCIYALVLIQAG